MNSPSRTPHALARNTNVQKDFYSYTFNVASLAAAASTSTIISIQANAAFIIMQSTYFAAIASAAQTESSRVIPLITVAITDSGSGRNLQDSATPISNVAGAAGLPYIWPEPRMIAASSTLKATFTNFDASITYTDIYLTLIGKQIFEY